MLTNAQKGLLKRAQKEAGLADEEYRELLRTVAGVESSTDPKITDRHLDKLLALFEAILWRGVDSGALQAPCKPGAVLRQRGFWARKNTSAETSRDRYVKRSLGEEVQELEAQLLAMGFHPSYAAAIFAKICGDRRDGRALFNYGAALRRTIAAKRRKLADAC